MSECEEDGGGGDGGGVTCEMKNANTSKKKAMMEFNMEALLHSLKSGRFHSLCGCRLQSIAVTHCMHIVGYT